MNCLISLTCLLVIFVVNVYPIAVRSYNGKLVEQSRDTFDDNQDINKNHDIDSESKVKSKFESQVSSDMEQPLSSRDFKKGEQLTVEDYEPMEKSADPLTDRNLLTDNTLLEGDIKENLESDRNAIRKMEMRWTNGQVPYVISREFDGKKRAVIAQAFKEYHSKTCIKFVPRRNQKDYIHIIPGSGCWSYVGRVGGRQEVSLQLNGCVYVGTAQHELMHALGFWHEQSRTDRDKYIQIRWENINPGAEHNFNKYTEKEIQFLGVSYDYNSIMHYGNKAFSKNNRETVVPRKSTAKIGNRKGFSRKDLEKINKLYECKKKS